MSARDDLAIEFGLDDELAEALVAAGWSRSTRCACAERPRVVTTAAELRALPTATALVNRIGVLYRRRDDSEGTYEFVGAGGIFTATALAGDGDWTVVWSPPAETGETGRCFWGTDTAEDRELCTGETDGTER